MEARKEKIGGQAGVAPDWYERAFDALYPIVYAHRSLEAAASEAAFVAERVGLTDRHDVLDLCCGAGRHMVHLLECARTVTGLDYSGDMLAAARVAVGRSQGSRAWLVRADMRAIPFCSAFDLVVNFFTSFGYFFAEEDNRSVVRGVAAALRPSGRFFIDHVNPPHVEQTLEPHTVREEAGYEIIEERWIDRASRRVNKSTLVRRRGRVVGRFHESVRLYEPEEFATLLRAGGLVVDEMLGDYSGQALDANGPRMIVIGHKA